MFEFEHKMVELSEGKRIEILMMNGYGDRRTQQEVCELFKESINITFHSDKNCDNVDG